MMLTRAREQTRRPDGYWYGTPQDEPSVPVKGSNPFISVSWLSKLMAWEKQCEWASRFCSHYV